MKEKRTGLWFLLACLAWCALYVLTPLLHAVALEKGWMPWSLNQSHLGVCVLACVHVLPIVLIVHTLVLVSKRKRLSAEVAQADTPSPEKLPWTIRTLRMLTVSVSFCLLLWIVVLVFMADSPLAMCVLFCLFLFVIFRIESGSVRKKTSAIPISLKSQYENTFFWRLLGGEAMLFVVTCWISELLIPELSAGRLHALFLPLMVFCLLAPFPLPESFRGRSNGMGLMFKKLFLVAFVHLALAGWMLCRFHADSEMLLRLALFCLVLGAPCATAMTADNERTPPPRKTRIACLFSCSLTCISTSLLGSGITRAMDAVGGPVHSKSMPLLDWQNAGLVEVCQLICIRFPAGWTILAIVSTVSMLAYFCIGLKVVGLPSCGKWTKASLAAGWLLVAVFFFGLAYYGIAQRWRVNVLAENLHGKCEAMAAQSSQLSQDETDNIEFQFLESSHWFDWYLQEQIFYILGMYSFDNPHSPMMGFVEEAVDVEHTEDDNEEDNEMSMMISILGEQSTMNEIMEELSPIYEKAAVIMKTRYPHMQNEGKGEHNRRHYREILHHFRNVIVLLAKALYDGDGQDIGSCISLLEHDIRLLEDEVSYWTWKMAVDDLWIVETMFKDKDMLSCEHGQQLKLLLNQSEDCRDSVSIRIKKRRQTSNLPIADAEWRDFTSNRMDAQRGLPSPNLCQAFSLDALVTWNISFRISLAKLVWNEDFPHMDDKFAGMPRFAVRLWDLAVGRDANEYDQANCMFFR